MCLPDVLRGSAVGELVCEVTAVGEYAGRPLKAGDAAQPVGLLCPLCACWFGPVGRSRTRNVLFGVRDGEKVVRCTRNAWFGVRGKGKVICECKPLSRQDCTESHISRGSVLRGLNVMLALGIVARRRRLT